MSASSLFKIIIHHVRHSTRQPFFRLVAYELSTQRVFEPSEFGSLRQLLETLRSVFPEFEENSLSLKEETETYVVFACERELTSAQLSILGLKPRG